MTVTDTLLCFTALYSSWKVARGVPAGDGVGIGTVASSCPFELTNLWGMETRSEGLWVVLCTHLLLRGPQLSTPKSGAGVPKQGFLDPGLGRWGWPTIATPTQGAAAGGGPQP